MPFEGETMEDVLGDCTALDPAMMPHAWRWAPRERVSTCGLEGSECPAWQAPDGNQD